jgi:hypothetical protein
VWRALLGLDPVVDHGSAPRQALLQHGLEVHRVLERLVNLLGECQNHRRRDALEAERQVRRPDDRLADRGQDAVALDQHLGALAGAPGRVRPQARRDVEVAGHRRTGLARHGLRAQLGEPARPVAREARVQVVGDREAQDHVPQEGQALVGLPALVDPARMRECLAFKIGWELVE